MKRVWLYFCSAALLAEAFSTWLQSFHRATDVPFAVTYRTQVEYARSAHPVGRVFCAVDDRCSSLIASKGKLTQCAG
jgi:hypothetical protein